MKKKERPDSRGNKEKKKKREKSSSSCPHFSLSLVTF